MCMRACACVRAHASVCVFVCVFVCVCLSLRWLLGYDTDDAVAKFQLCAVYKLQQLI